MKSTALFRTIFDRNQFPFYLVVLIEVVAQKKHVSCSSLHCFFRAKCCPNAGDEEWAVGLRLSFPTMELAYTIFALFMI